jgi:multidrug efflux pump
MNVSAPFIKRPVGTSLLTLALLLAGVLAFNFLPVAPLPQVEFPVIQVSAGLPGASPETMASAVATPLERQFGRIAGITQMTSTSQLGSTNVTLQFDLNRNIDAAARDVQAAINAARGQLPANLPNNPSYRKVNPADVPILILALSSDTITLPRIYDGADTILAQKLAQVGGVGQVVVGGGARPAVRAELNPTLLNKLGVGFDQVRTALAAANANRPKGEFVGRGQCLGDQDHRASRQHPREFPGDCRSFSGLPLQRAYPDSGCAGHGIHRVGRALRKLHSSHHHPFHFAFCGRGRALGAVADP